MGERILTVSNSLEKGEIIERPNRFTLIVKLGGSSEKVYLANPGALSTVIGEGKEVLCQPAHGENRKTNYDAFAIKTDNIYVTVKSIFANRIFSKILEKNLLENFKEYSIISKEPELPDEGRSDFLVKNEKQNVKGFIEVKSCTHVEKGIAKFPDRPTKRGRRHLRSLTKLIGEGWDNHIVFVVQRGDALKFQPFRKVDPEFSDLLSKAEKKGVGIYALSTEFKPPNLYLKNESLTIDFV